MYCINAVGGRHRVVWIRLYHSQGWGEPLSDSPDDLDLIQCHRNSDIFYREQALRLHETQSAYEM